jgi:dTDP-4-amino-4,6-dideoxygalactose transaminase
MTDARLTDLPLVDLTRIEDRLVSGAKEAFDRIVRAGSFTLGSELEAFEQDFAAYCGREHCIGLSNGTDALRLTLLALGAGPGKEIITVPHTFIGTIEAISMTGARPILVDIDPVTRCLAPEELAESVSPHTAAVIPVHLYGRPAPVEEIVSVCGDIPVVEDAAQAHGAVVAHRRAGSLGAAGCFSFYPTKNLGAMGDAGAVICDDPTLALTVRSLRHHGADASDASRHLHLGSTARLDNLQAAILRLKLEYLDGWNEERRGAAARYREALADLPVTLPPPDPPEGRQVFHLFVIELDDRDRVLAALHERGIGAAVHYPTPVHLQPACRHLRYPAGSFPNAEAAADRVLSLPMFPGITEGEIERVADTLRRVIR